MPTLTDKQFAELLKAASGRAGKAAPIRVKAEVKAPSLDYIISDLKGAEVVADERHGAGRYMIRKAGAYGLAVATSVGQQQRRFHLVRLAAALGEIKGHMHARVDRSSHAQS